MRQMVEDGTARDNGEAYALLCKSHPALVERYKQERQQARPQSRPPLDYSQRQALSKQQDYGPTVPPPTSGYADFVSMVDALMRQHPGMSEGQAKLAVMQQNGGREAFERHRQQQLFGRR
jgi:hypothetical protein